MRRLIWVVLGCLAACGTGPGTGDADLGARTGNGGILIGRYEGVVSTHALEASRPECAPLEAHAVGRGELTVSRVDADRVRVAIRITARRADAGSGPQLSTTCEATMRADVNRAFAVEPGTSACTFDGMSVAFAVGSADGTYVSGVSAALASAARCVHFVGQPR